MIEAEKIVMESLDGYNKCIRLSYGSSRNKLNIVKELAQKYQHDDLRRSLWNDLRTRLGWYCRFLSTGKDSVRGSIEGISQYNARLAGWKEYPEILGTSIRMHTTVSFTKEPCNSCKKLEHSFIPNDGLLRTETDPFENQYTVIFESMISDVYRMMGAANYHTDQAYMVKDELIGKKTKRGHDYQKVYDWIDIAMEMSRNFLYYGRRCFFETEQQTRKQLDKVNRTRWKQLEEDILIKYGNKGNDTMKCIGGVFNLNTELLCSECAKNVEENPIQRG